MYVKVLRSIKSENKSLVELAENNRKLIVLLEALENNESNQDTDSLSKLYRETVEVCMELIDTKNHCYLYSSDGIAYIVELDHQYDGNVLFIKDTHTEDDELYFVVRQFA